MKNQLMIRDQFLPRFFNEPLFSSFDWDNMFYDFQHRFDLEEDENGDYSLVLELPGYKQSEVNVEYDNGLLTVTAKNKRGQIVKSLSLNETIDPEKVEAKLEDGLLTLKLSKNEKVKPKKIEVK